MWDQRYSTDAYIYGTEPNKFLASVADRIPNGDVLCLAEGEGRNSVYLAGQGFDVTGVDSSMVGLRKAQRLADEKGVTITTIHADLAEYKIEPDSWDSIISIFCHLPSELRRKVHRDCVSGLKRGGVFILEAFTPDQLKYDTGGPKNPDLLYTLDDLKDDLHGLAFKIAHEIERDTTEGSHHTGTAAVVQIVAVKQP